MYEMMLLLVVIVMSWWLISTVGTLLFNAWKRHRSTRDRDAGRGLESGRRSP